MERKERIFLLSLFVIAFALRLGFTLMAKQHYFFYHNPSADVTYYLEWAKEIATTNFIGNKAFFGLPLFPHVLAVLYRIALGNIEVIRLFFLLLGSLNCLLLYFLAQKTFDQRIAVLGSLFMAFNFFMIYYDWLIMPVTLIITLSLIILLALTDRKHLTRSRHWAILGFLIGITVLADGKFLFFLFISVLWLWRKEPEQRKSILIMCLTAVTILGLCAARNKLVSGDWIMISAQSGLSLYTGNNETATGTYLSPEFIRPTHQAQDEDQKIVAEAIMNRSMSPGEISRFWKNKAMIFIVNHPGQYLKLLAKKLTLFFRDTEYGYDLDLILMRDWKYRFNWNALIILFPLALIGMAVSVKQWRERPFAVFLILCQLIFTLIFFLQTRHRSTILPLLIMFEAVAIFWFTDLIKARKIKHIAVGGVFILLFMVLFRPIVMDDKIVTFNRYAKAGPVYEKQGNLEMAKKCYFRALQLRPFDSVTLYNLGNIYVLEKNWDKAKKLYKKALNICSFHVDAAFNLAYVYEQTGQTDKAISYYKKIIRYQPAASDTYFRMANLYAKAGKCDKAIPLYQKVAELNPVLAGHMQEYIQKCR